MGLLILPSVDEAGVQAVKLSDTLNPELSANEQAFLIAGFSECIVWLNSLAKEPDNAQFITLSETAKKKLEFIKGHSICRDFPYTPPNTEWVGAVLDLLDELKLL